MTALVPSKIQGRLTNIATRFSKQVEARLAEIQRTTQTRVSREAAIRAQRVREQKEEEKRQTQWLAKRMPLARVGLARILAVGGSEPVQRIISNLKRIQQFSGVMTFYEAHRLSGEAFDLPDKEIDFSPATRDVEFLFYSDHLRVFCGALSSSNGVTWDIPYNLFVTDSTVLRAEFHRQEEKKTIEDFLTEIASPYPSNMSVASYWRQRSSEWDPDDIAFQLLVSCARPARLNNYLKKLTSAVPV